MKRKTVIKLTACCIIGSMLTTGATSLATEAAEKTDLILTAGAARHMENDSLDDNITDINITFDKHINGSSEELSSVGSENIKSDGSENKKAENTTVMSDSAESISAGAGSDIEINSDSVTDMNLIDAVKESENTELEDSEDLFVAQNYNYVYMRSEPSEDSECTGKLYNDAVGNVLAKEGDWVKIKSGNAEGYVKSDYIVMEDEAKDLVKTIGDRNAKVITTTLYVRADASKDAEIIGLVPMDDILTVLEVEDDGWVKVSVEEGEGYVSNEFVTIYTEYLHAESKEEEEERLEQEKAERKKAREALRNAETEQLEATDDDNNNHDNADNRNHEHEEQDNADNDQADASEFDYYAYEQSDDQPVEDEYQEPESDTGSVVAKYALQFVGNPYVYGGSSLTNGADCSGFVMSVYKKFGISLPHSSGADRSVGYAVNGGLSNARPGDLICYSGHVALYIGNGQIVHASSAKTGIKISNANYREPVAVRRIF